MNPKKITITIELVENEVLDPMIANHDRVAEDILEHLAKLPHDALLSADTYDFFGEHRHQQYRVKYY